MRILLIDAAGSIDCTSPIAFAQRMGLLFAQTDLMPCLTWPPSECGLHVFDDLKAMALR
jgi:hypothetical protein